MKYLLKNSQYLRHDTREIYLHLLEMISDFTLINTIVYRYIYIMI